ncbi:MAG: ABC transporter permease subunit [Euryarchaeota archaeon]|nr:ABC transporter permease subunit [Euryarchaeota archaeon]
MIEVHKVLSLYRFQILWHKRSMALWILLLLTLAVVAGIIFEPYLLNPRAHVSVHSVAESLSGGSTFVILLAALFLGSDALSREFQRKTAYFLLPTPVKRVTILTAKFLGTYIVSGVLLLIYFGVGAGYMAVAYHAVPVRYFASMALAYLYLASLLAFTYMFSAVFDSGAAVATLIFMIVIFGNVVIFLVENVMHIEPWFWLWYGTGIITLVYAGSYIGDYSHISLGPMGNTTYNPYIWEGILIMLGYFIISFLVAAWCFERKELR